MQITTIIEEKGRGFILKVTAWEALAEGGSREVFHIEEVYESQEPNQQALAQRAGGLIWNALHGEPLA